MLQTQLHFPRFVLECDPEVEKVDDKATPSLLDRRRGRILRRRFLHKVPVSDLCVELGLSPNVFHSWQKASFENGAGAHKHLAHR